MELTKATLHVFVDIKSSLLDAQLELILQIQLIISMLDLLSWNQVYTMAKITTLLIEFEKPREQSNNLA